MAREKNMARKISAKSKRKIRNKKKITVNDNQGAER